MASNIGFQQVTVKYFDAVDSPIANRIGGGIRKPGIYSGGYLTRVSDTSVTVSALDCEIGDGTNQVRIQTGVGGSGVITVTGLSVAVPYVVLKWTATTDSTTDYMECVAETAANVLANSNWIIVGKCSFPGGTLTPGYGWDSTDKIITRTNPNVQDLFLKVEPTVAASMYVRIRGGRVSYGTSNYDVADQLSPLLTAPSSNSWIVAIQVNSSGAIVATYGDSGASPSAPDYGGLVTLAEITIPSGTSSIIASMIKDTRTFVGNGNPVSIAASIITDLPAGGVINSYSNLKVVRTSVTSVTITADELILGDTSNNTVKIYSVSKVADITVSGAGGLDTGVEGNAWYYIWIIRKSTDGTVAALLSLSATSPTMPSGYDQKALVSAVHNTSGNFVNFIHEGKRYANVVHLSIAASDTSSAWSAIDLTEYVPSALSSFCYGSIYNASISGISNSSSPAFTAATAAANKIEGTGVGGQTITWQFHILTANTLYYASNSASNIVYLHGFEINKI